MRPVHLTDIDMVTRVLLAVPTVEWAAVARRIIQGARMADRYRKRFGQRHPVWGDGSLSAASAAQPGAVPPTRCHATYRQALIIVIDALEDSTTFDIVGKSLYDDYKAVVREERHGHDKSEIAQP